MSKINLKKGIKGFVPKYTQEDLDLIREMKKAGKDRGSIFYVMLQRRPDVHSITIGRWIDGVVIKK